MVVVHLRPSLDDFSTTSVSGFLLDFDRPYKRNLVGPSINFGLVPADIGIPWRRCAMGFRTQSTCTAARKRYDGCATACTSRVYAVYAQS